MFLCCSFTDVDVYVLQQIHKDFLGVAVAKLGELKSGAASVDDGLVTFVKGWLMNHIKGSDIPSYGK